MEKAGVGEAPGELKDFLDGVSDFIGILDHDWNLIYINKTAAKAFGFEQHDLFGKNLWKTYPNSVGTAFEEILRDVAIKKQPRRFEWKAANPKHFFEIGVFPSAIGITLFGNDITDRKKAREALRISEERLMLALKGSQEGVWDWNVETNEVWYSNRWRAMLGYSNPGSEIEPNFSAFERLVHPDDKSRYKEMLEDFFQGKRDYEIELRLRHKDGHYVDILSRGFPVRRVPGGKVTRIVGTHLDLTERNTAEKSIRSSEARFRSLYENSLDAILLTIPDGTILAANPAAERLFGMSEEELKKAGRSGVFVYDEKGIAVLEERDRTGKVTGEFTFRRKDGSTFEGEGSSSCFTEADGTIKTSMIIRDITERKRVGEALKESEERFRILSETSPDAIIVHSSGVVLYANPAALELYGASSFEQLASHAIFRLIPDQETEESTKRSELVAVGPKPPLREAEVTRLDGLKVPVEVISSPIKYRGVQAVNVIICDITKRKKDEESLRESEQLYKTIFDNSEDGFHLQELLYDGGKVVDARSLKVNPAFEKQTGLKGADIVGRRVSEYAPNTKPSPLEVLDNVLRTGKPVHVESFNPDTNSYYDVHYFPYSKSAVGGLFRDITERKRLEVQVEQRARQSALERQRLFNVLEGLPALVCLLTPDYHVAFANRAFREKHGESRGRHCYEYCRGRTGPCNDCESYAVLTTGSPHCWELTLDDGTVFDAHSFPFTDIDGSPMVLEMDLDITDRKSAEAEVKRYRAHLEDLVEEQTKELRRSRDELERRVEERAATVREQAELIDKANDGILIIDLKGNIMSWNKGAEKIYGWSREEAMGRNASELLQHDPLQIEEAIKSITSSCHWIGEMKTKTKDGKELIVESSWTLVNDAEQKPKSIMTINTDITEKKQLEAQYLRAQRLESLGTLAGGIAHDFRNILTPLMIGLDLVDKDLTSKEDHETVALMQKNLKRGADLSGQLLTFTRGNGGQRVPISVPALIHEIAKTIKETFPRSISIEIKADPELPAIMGDSTQLHQVLINMCINARDAMPFGGALSITAENFFVDSYFAKLHHEAKVGPYVVLSVIDGGVGMTPEVKDRLFEPFFTTKKQGEGTGLGLPTARSIVKNHGGFIEVSSEVGKGSAFRIYLPFGETKNNPQSNSEGKNPSAGKGQTILIVDDEKPIRMTTSAALESNGYSVLEASDGAEALSVYTMHKGEIKAVLLDMVMPILDGEATIRALKTINPEVTIIGMSGFAEEGRFVAMHSVAKAFVLKPFTAEKLLDILAKVLAN